MGKNAFGSLFKLQRKYGDFLFSKFCQLKKHLHYTSANNNKNLDEFNYFYLTNQRINVNSLDGKYEFKVCETKKESPEIISERKLY